MTDSWLAMTIGISRVWTKYHRASNEKHSMAKKKKQSFNCADISLFVLMGLTSLAVMMQMVTIWYF